MVWFCQATVLWSSDTGEWTTGRWCCSWLRGGMQGWSKGQSWICSPYLHIFDHSQQCTENIKKVAHLSPFWRFPTPRGMIISDWPQTAMPTPVYLSPTENFVLALASAWRPTQVLIYKSHQGSMLGKQKMWSIHHHRWLYWECILHMVCMEPYMPCRFPSLGLVNNWKPFGSWGESWHPYIRWPCKETWKRR